MIFVRIFILSFCSMSYQLLMARSLAEITQHHIFGYSISFGFFLLGMGIGGIYYAKSLIQKSPLKVFFSTEIFLALLGGLAVFFIFFSHTLLNLLVFSDMNNFFSGNAKDFIFIFFSQSFLFLIGFFSGFELPIWLKLAEARKNSQGILNKTGALLAASYMGGFAGSLLLTLLIAPIFGLISSCILIGFINVIILIETFVSYKNLSLKKSFAILVSIFFLYMGNYWQKEILQMNLKSYYLRVGLSEFSFKAAKDFFSLLDDYNEILRVRTTYQNVDIILFNFLRNSSQRNFPFRDRTLHLFLNRFHQFEFSLDKFNRESWVRENWVRESWVDYYDTSLVGGAILAGGEPKNILIVGAGGHSLGLPRVLKFYKGVRKITLLDIDPFMIKIGRSYKPISSLNPKDLLKHKLNIIIDDAFDYVSKTMDTYDAVFIQFPSPYTFDLSRLYSFEFYKNLSHLLEEDGFILMDARSIECGKAALFNEEGFQFSGSPVNILYSTLTYAGYNTIIIYGRTRSCLLFAQKIKRDEISFKKKAMKKYPLSKRREKELVINKDIKKSIEIKRKYINSVFKPTFFRY